MADLSSLQTPLQDPISSLYKDKVSAPVEQNKLADVYSKLGISDQAPAQSQFTPMPVPDVKKRVQETMGLYEPQFKKEEALVKDIGAFEGEQKLAEIEQQRIQAQGEREAYAKYAEDMKRTELRQRREQLQKEIEKPFIPTQESAQDLATLFSLINVVGFAFGTGGKQNAQVALSAMNGMLEGHQKGRDDVYKREKDTFEENLKVLKNKIESLSRDMEEAAEIAKTNLELGTRKAEEAALKYGATFIKQNIEKFGLVKTLEYTQRVNDAMNKAIDTAITHRDNVELKNFELMNRMAKQTGNRSAINERFQNTVLRSANETLRSLQLIEQIGIQTGKGYLGGVAGRGTMVSEVAANISRSLTDEEQMAYNAAAGAMALELAYVLNGGYKPTVEITNELKNLYLATPQDTVGTAAYKFSDVAAKLKAALEVAPSFTQQQEKTRGELLSKLERYASPETVYQRVYGVGARQEPLVRSGEYKTITRRGKVEEGPNKGKTIIEYSDGTREYK